MIGYLSPLHVEGHNCIEDSIAIVSAYYHRGYEMMFGNMWGFGLKDGTETLGERIILPGADPELLQRYHGIKIRYHDLEGGRLLEAVKTELQFDRPAGIVLDAFYAPWHQAYRIDHVMNHLVIVTALGSGGSLTCTCGDPLLFGVPLSAENFSRAAKGLVTFECIGETEKADSPESQIMAAIQKFDVRKSTENLRRFAQSIGSVSDIRPEICGTVSYLNAPILARLLEAGRTRLKFAEFLRFLSRKAGTEEWIDSAALEFTNIASVWSTARSMLIKGIVCGNMALVNGRIKSRLMQVADLEQSMYDRLNRKCSLAYRQ